MAPRLDDALARIDAINSADPHRIVIDGRARPKESTHAAMVSAWVQRLRPDADDALRIAAHGHHVRRWAIARADFPAGRRGYLRWRRALHQLHAETLAEVMQAAGYDPPVIARAQAIVRKHDLPRDPDVQALEDALCLVFLQTQLADLRASQTDAKMTAILQKTWGKMSAAARQLALSLPLPAAERAFIRRALHPPS